MRRKRVRGGRLKVRGPAAVAVIILIVVVALARQWRQGPSTAPAGTGGATASVPAPGAPRGGGTGERPGGPREAMPEPGSLRADVAGAPPPAAGFIRIAAWNIEWLGTPNTRGSDAKGVQQSPRDLAVVVKLMGADVVGLEEIKGLGGARGGDVELSNPVLDGVLTELKALTGASWRYRLFPNVRNLNDQCCGVLWNTGRVTSAGFHPLEIDESLAPPGKKGLLHRRPVLAEFRTGEGRTDFGLVVVHLKCCNEAEQRGAEARAIVKALGPMMEALGERDVLIMGDANVSRADEPALAELAGAGFTDLNAAGVSTYIAGGGPLDRAFSPPATVGTGPQPEFAQSTFTVYTYPGLSDWQQRVLLSDHRPVYIDVRTMADDD